MKPASDADDRISSFGVLIEAEKGLFLAHVVMVDRTPEIATLLRQKPAAAEGPIQGIGRHNATEAALVLRDRMEALWRDQNALRERMACIFQ